MIQTYRLTIRLTATTENYAKLLHSLISKMACEKDVLMVELIQREGPGTSERKPERKPKKKAA